MMSDTTVLRRDPAPRAAPCAHPLERLRAIADQAPLEALRLSRAVNERAMTMGFARVKDVRSATWPQLVHDFGESGAREIAAALAAAGLGDAGPVDRTPAEAVDAA